jgi:Protein of unknown function (DUF3047)
MISASLKGRLRAAFFMMTPLLSFRAKTIRGCLAGVLLLAAGCTSPPQAPLESAHHNLSEWMEYALPGKRTTRYTQLVLEGRPVVHATSESAASIFRRRVRLEPAELGKVRFSWRVAELIQAADLNDGDSADSPVRLILAFDGDHSRLSLRNRLSFDLAHAVSGETPPFATLMYVWDNKAALESIIHSGRTDRVRKIVLESGSSRLGKWRHYERDIAADFRKTFGEEPGALLSVGLMTDADNTRSSAEAWYGEVLLEGPDGRPR